MPIGVILQVLLHTDAGLSGHVKDNGRATHSAFNVWVVSQGLRTRALLRRALTRLPGSDGHPPTFQTTAGAR